jgi:hypothetical protein
MAEHGAQVTVVHRAAVLDRLEITIQAHQAAMALQG